eukprot:3998983-Amphidinium_carterae.1
MIKFVCKLYQEVVGEAVGCVPSRALSCTVLHIWAHIRHIPQQLKLHGCRSDHGVAFIHRAPSLREANK